MKSIKKIISLLLVFPLLLSTVGIVHFVHYCDGDYKASSFILKPSCCCGDEDVADACCKNVVTVSQLDNEFIYTEKASLVKPIIASAFFTLILSSSHITLSATTRLSPVSDLQYKLHDPPLYLKNNAFLI